MTLTSVCLFELEDSLRVSAHVTEDLCAGVQNGRQRVEVNGEKKMLYERIKTTNLVFNSYELVVYVTRSVGVTVVLCSFFECVLFTAVRRLAD